MIRFHSDLMMEMMLKCSMYHGSSIGALGPQLVARKFDVRPHHPIFFTREQELAIKYALESAFRTQTPPVLLQIESNQKPIHPWDLPGNHGYWSYDSVTAPVKIVKVANLSSSTCYLGDGVKMEGPPLTWVT